MTAAAKLQTLSENVQRPGAGVTTLRPSRRVARDFALLLGIALGIGLLAGLGMMLTVLLLA